MASIRYYQKISYYDLVFLFENRNKKIILCNFTKKNTIFALLFYLK